MFSFYKKKEFQKAINKLHLPGGFQWVSIVCSHINFVTTTAKGNNGIATDNTEWRKFYAPN